MEARLAAIFESHRGWIMDYSGEYLMKKFFNGSFKAIIKWLPHILLYGIFDLQTMQRASTLLIIGNALSATILWHSTTSRETQKAIVIKDKQTHYEIITILSSPGE